MAELFKTDPINLTKPNGDVILSPFKKYKQESLNDYEIISQLGKGAQGSIFSAVRASDRKLVALKVFDINDLNPEVLKLAEHEAEALQQLSIPNCNPFLGCYYDHFYDEEQKKFVIVMEYIRGKTAYDYFYPIRNQDKDKLYYYLLLMTKDLIKGIIYLHSRGFIHNDIKPDNIMINLESVPKLVDFGLSCLTVGPNAKQCYDNGNTIPCCSGYGGTPAFASPEMLTSETRYPQSDIWSLGVSLYLLATGQYPFDFKGVKNTYDILNTIRNQIPKKLFSTNPLLNKIVNRALIKDPFRRTTATEINSFLEKI